MIEACIRESCKIPKKLSPQLKKLTTQLEELYKEIQKTDKNSQKYIDLIIEYEDKSEWLEIKAKTDNQLSQKDFESLYFRYYVK